MKDYVVKMFNVRSGLYDWMYIIASNTFCAREEALRILHEEWDYPDDWELGEPQKLF